MGRFFNRERFGTPQILAGFLLLAFLAECFWLIAHQPPSTVPPDELARIEAGLAQWHGHAIAGSPAAANSESVETPGNDQNHSPLWYLIGAAPVRIFSVAPGTKSWLWLTHLPYVFCGVLLGASLWYVARRLYGNAGGYVALLLYCFSPAVIRASALWFSQPNITGAWGTFGAVFTAIAVSHTLYAPREVVLWNWRRIVLLGVSLALAVGSQFSLALIVPLILVFMLYLAPARRAAACAIFTAACLVAALLLFASYFFHATIFWQSLLHARLLDMNWRALEMAGAYSQAAKEVAASGPVLVLLVPAALFAYAYWRRTRYFGNLVPLLMTLLFVALRVASPHDPESVLTLLALVFLFLFVAGIAADLLETKASQLIAAVLGGLLAANALWNLTVLAQIR
jgi:hypothetical protein